MASRAATAAITYKILHAFHWASNPTGNLIFEAAGNLYGTTANGGSTKCSGGCGAVYRLTPKPDGNWTLAILYAFTGADGANPYAGLIFDAAGNLYGTTYLGGSTACPYGCGVVFKLKPNPDGTWTESVLHSFTGPDGAAPLAGLIFDAAGNLYGTTANGGADNNGVVFKLTPGPDGTWTESVLYSFTGGADGANPWLAGLVFDAAGNLYGMTEGGGGSGRGVVLKLTPNPDGTWTESVLHSFTGPDGSFPFAGLILDAAGNLYGTTDDGGSGGCTDGCGVVFKLAPNPDGTWTESVLYSFRLLGGGARPHAGLTFDAAGNLYGTTLKGGAYDYGVVFKLAPSSTGWKETVLHTFGGLGKYPFAPVIFDPAGNLYGTTSSGSSNYGLVFEIAP